jgi:CRP-like cAMP-binding protein
LSHPNRATQVRPLHRVAAPHRGRRAATPVRVLELDGGLGHLLEGERLAQATDHLRGRLIAVEPGSWDVSALRGQTALSAGLLVTEGFIARELFLDARASVELLGPGDLLRPWDEAESLLPIEATWNVLSPVRAVVLGPGFTGLLGAFPEVALALLERVHDRAQRLAESQAIAHTTLVRDRLHAMLWHLADRWGHVTPEGVSVPLALSHRMLAECVGAHRPTVSAGLAELARRGLVARRADGTWLLTGTAPPARKASPGRRAPLRRRFVQPDEASRVTTYRA